MSGIVVIGAGQAGSSLVAKLRSLGFDGAISLIGAENAPPYQRPPLSKKYLLGEMEQERLYLRPEQFYADNDIDLRLGTPVSAIDTSSQTVRLGDDTLHYDQLALTTGSVPRRLPASMGGDLDGVYVVRNLADVDAMAPKLQDGTRVLIVGGGYIGLEAAAVAASRGLNVVLVEMADRILQRVAAPETSQYFRALHQSHGVEIIEGLGLKTLTGEGHVDGAILEDGRKIEVDFAIVGVGIVPGTDLALASGIDVENGIKTDAFGRTSAANVWAAGDCASFPYRGAQMRLESVPNAIDMAECVAQNMLGSEVAYVPQPWFWSDQYDTKLQIAGLNTGYDRVITRQSEGGISFWYFKGTDLLAVDAANDARAYMVGKRLIDAARTVAPEQLTDPATDLKSLLRV